MSASLQGIVQNKTCVSLSHLPQQCAGFICWACFVATQWGRECKEVSTLGQCDSQM
jgi:hypothetical protein